MNSLFAEAGRHLAGASIANADNIPLSPVLQAAELGHRLAEELENEEVALLPETDDQDGAGALADGQSLVGEISTASLGAVRDGSQQTVAGQDGDALRPVVATDHAGTLLQMEGRTHPGGGVSTAGETSTDGAITDGTVTGPSTIEVAYKHQRPPTLAQLRVNNDKSTCKWMRAVVATWPQPLNSKGRRDIDADEEDITAACVEGTNATLKTWSTRRRTAIAFADFLSRTVCRDRSEPPPTQGQLDHRVRRAFLCMTPDTRSYITLFLEARQRGYPVAGSSSPITVLTLEDYSSALVFLFGEALMEGTTGGPKVVPDCEQRNSKWKQKGVAERAEEAKIREQPGSMIGNPMHTDVLKRYKSAAEKDARVHGEQSVTSAPVTAAMMHRLYATLVMSYLPGHGVPAGCTPPPGPDVAPPPGSATPAEKAVPSSLAKCDFIVYCLYAFAWMTLARPLSLISMKHKDVSLPDLSLPRNQEFMNR